ncbi:jg383, partial [Pararge aegeria aegeria]
YLPETGEVIAPEDNDKPREEVQPVIIKPTSKKPLKVLKMEHVSIKLTEAQFPKEMEQPQFSKIKLKKPDVKSKKEQTSTVLPKVQLKSRIKFVTDWPPDDVKPIITFLKSVRQNGELSRNIKEAAKLKKKKLIVPEISDVPKTPLEKPDLVDYIKEDTKPRPEESTTNDRLTKEFIDEEIVKKKNIAEHEPSEISSPGPVVKKKMKLKPMTIVEKVIEPNLPQFAESIEEPQFKKIQLKKGIVKTKLESSVVKIPKIQLKSRIKFVGDWPPKIIKPNLSFLGGVRQNGILSRNIKEAAKIKKTVFKQPVLPEIEKIELEKPMFTQEDIIGIKISPEKEDEKLHDAGDNIQDEPEQFTIASRRPSVKKIEEFVDEVTIKKKLKPVRKSSITLPEITEPEEVTFRPKITKTKEEVEQEFNIHLDSYEEEEISMTSKVKLKPQRQPTFNEEENEVSIKVYEEKESVDDNIVEIIDSDVEKDEGTNVIMPLKKPVKPLVNVDEEITSSVIMSKPKSHTQAIEFTEDVTFELGDKTKYLIDDQEISFDVKKQKDEFKSEELSLSSKIKLARKKKLTIDEAGDETSIRLEKEIEDDGQVDEIIISDSESEER